MFFVLVMPVTIKSTQGVVVTETVNVSKTGLAVARDPVLLKLAPRQYVELELTLPGNKLVSVTGVVARLIDEIEYPDGRRAAGVRCGSDCG